MNLFAFLRNFEIDMELTSCGFMDGHQRYCRMRGVFKGRRFKVGNLHYSSHVDDVLLDTANKLLLKAKTRLALRGEKLDIPEVTL